MIENIKHHARSLAFVRAREQDAEILNPYGENGRKPAPVTAAKGVWDRAFMDEVKKLRSMQSAVDSAYQPDMTDHRKRTPPEAPMCASLADLRDHLNRLEKIGFDMSAAWFGYDDGGLIVVTENGGHVLARPKP